MSTFPVTLLFADGATHSIEATQGQKLMEAAEAAGLSLLTDCANGQCGTCAAQCVSGRMDLDHYDASVLPDEDRDDGAVLCCVARVDGPCIVELPYDASDASADEPPAQTGRVHSVQDIAHETVRLEVDVDTPLHFLPGQYVRVRPNGEAQWRSYSMANGSGETRLVFYVRRVAGGMFSRWLETAAAPGAQMEVGAPRGSFFLREEERPRLFVAGGTGLAPFLAMLRCLSGKPSPASTRLLVGARTADHLFAQAEIEAIKASIPGLEVQYAAEQAGGDSSHAGYHTGFATDLIAAANLDPATRVYLCGPPPMVDAGREAAVRAGVRKADVLCERFA